MDAPSFSTFAALSELVVTSGVLYVVITNFKGRGFKGKVALAVILFEFFINMMYMIVRMDHHSAAPNPNKLFIAFAAAHGSLSLLVFILLVVYCSLAYADMKKGRHFFQEHKKQTYVFLALWLTSIISGEILYFISY